MPASQASLAIALHGVSRQRDDRQPPAVAAGRTPSFSHSRIALRRLEPTHLGHLQVHQHDVERRALVQTATAATALRPFSTAFTLWPRFLSSVVTSLRLTGLSSATSTCSDAARPRADSLSGRLRASVPRRHAEQPAEGFEKIGVLDRLGQERRRCSFLWRCTLIVRLPDRRQHHDRHLRQPIVRASRGARA